MEEQPASVKQILRKFLFSKNSTTTMMSNTNYKIVPCGIDCTTGHGETENRGAESKNYASVEWFSGNVGNSFSTSNEENSMFEKNISLTENDNKTSRVVIPIIILTDFTKKYVESRPLL